MSLYAGSCAVVRERIKVPSRYCRPSLRLTLTLGSALIGCVLVGSFFLYAGVGWGHCAVGCYIGGIDISYLADSAPLFCEYRRSHLQELWPVPWFPMYDNSAGGQGIFLPLWPVLLALLVPTIVLWRRFFRLAEASCKRCGYDLAGNVSGRCPECGEPVTGKGRN